MKKDPALEALITETLKPQLLTEDQMNSALRHMQHHFATKTAAVLTKDSKLHKEAEWHHAKALEHYSMHRMENAGVPDQDRDDLHFPYSDANSFKHFRHMVMMDHLTHVGDIHDAFAHQDELGHEGTEINTINMYHNYPSSK
jgi:hypothetical protein